MSDKDKYSFIVVKYPAQATADEALQVVLGLAKEKVVKLRDAVAITKTEKGKIKLHQTKDDTAKKGFIKGGGIGVLFALLFGPVGWVAAGAALGGAFAMFDRGIKNKLLKELGENMTPEQSAMAVPALVILPVSPDGTNVMTIGLSAEPRSPAFTVGALGSLSHFGGGGGVGACVA